MRTLYLFALIYISVTLTSCAMSEPSNHSLATATTTTTQVKKSKNPLAVTLYIHSKPKLAYNIIGEESISKYNTGGNVRQEALIRDGMRELAAAMGGDAVIDLKQTRKSITGTVVAFQNQTETTKV